MVDNMNPTNQFHPYQRETSVPVAERPQTGLNGMLNKVGIDPTSVRSISDQMKNLNVNDIDRKGARVRESQSRESPRRSRSRCHRPRHDARTEGVTTHA